MADGMQSSSRRDNRTRGRKWRVFLRAGCLAVAAAVVLCCAGTIGLPFCPDRHNGRTPGETVPPVVSEEVPDSEGKDLDAKNTEEKESVKNYPKSAFFRQLAWAIWGKEYTAITAEEYARLTSIQMNKDEKTVLYQLDYGYVYTLSFLQEAETDFADLSVFSGLEWISVDDSLHPGDLEGLEHLFGIYAENTLAEMADIVPYPEKITDLGVVSTSERSLEGLEVFSNLQYFCVDYRGLEDISVLLQFPNLRGLILERCDDLKDYSPLLSMQDLEWLKIASRGLENIDFIRQMPELESLCIEGSSVSSLDALEACGRLCGLTLLDNPGISDYSVLGSLSGLKDLALETGTGIVLPSFAGLIGLERLTLKGIDDLVSLREAVSLTCLSLEGWSGQGADTLAVMEKLAALSIRDSSVQTDILEPLMELGNLVSLDLSGTTVQSNMEGIFQIPTIKYLYIDNCDFGLDFGAMSVNQTLETLSMDGISVWRESEDGSEEKISLAEHCDMFRLFPNLREASLVSLGLKDIRFVEELPHLQYLNIRGNAVTSLKPLERLEDFRAVWCQEESVREGISEGSGISVIYEDR